ncbi:5'-methylthioadenosine/S-adenosylhomocysteine nucleosidase [Novosphingobium mangrovi (ex Hu et al. 2023)]|uniref:5'-methylthioadenosine/S-adenosylhomocysteine nucleosidase n=1 Tax=Novosphingobium mangrovi (ex Hu et al. 2023) TaxID=2930094 RepID=A0ABT0AED5_9SPHN|nr:5'-methylthioadenosine/S-adenosylhomocysteine nucleosidase [Novosphingobium mangrovi (ex Hu et al. 2023)]MCJ1961553.1 5'-methylthioadenosine/S-adenosylhomocysteine nucleosidase [Novosphingobium mangrovi (ex Hu et al. 2023)]
MRRAMSLLATALALVSAPALAEPFDTTPRTVVMTAFAPEWDALAPAIVEPREYSANGLTFLAGTLEGKPVVLMQSGVSMVNAAMNTQLVLDRFKVKRIVFSGIAGGVDPELSIGDVVVARDWAQYLEVSFARRAGEGWVTPEPVDAQAPANWEMMFPRGVRVGNASEAPVRHYTLGADPALLQLAEDVTARISLQRCTGPSGTASGPHCLVEEPKVVVGGTGVSAGVFADNKEFREYLQAAWGARVVDMESAAVVQVAYANEVPAIVFRSLSDLAGGDDGENQMNTFMALASVNSAHVVRAFLAALPD